MYLRYEYLYHSEHFNVHRRLPPEYSQEVFAALSYSAVGEKTHNTIECDRRLTFRRPDHITASRSNGVYPAGQSQSILAVLEKLSSGFIDWLSLTLVH
jgi:hypothetical protein